MTTFLWNHICRWLREDFILGLHWRWKISQFSAYSFTNLFLLPQWVLSLKGQFRRCHWKIPTSPFLSNPWCTIHRSCRGSRGGEGGEGRRRKEQEGERLHASVSPETSLPLAFIARPLSAFAVRRPLSIHWGPAHFHRMIHRPWTMLQSGLVLMLSVVSGSCLRTGTFGLVWVFWVLSSAWPPKMDDKAWWAKTNESQRRKNTD